MAVSHHKALHQLPGIPEDMILLRSRPQPREMSDAELLRFGIVAKYMSLQEKGLEDAQRRTFASQLIEVRKEWKRRFTSLPLAVTFDQEEP